jgi:hypothetical protein
MSNYFDLLESELRAATERNAVVCRPRWRRLGRWTGGVAIASAVAVPLVITLLAVALLGHAHRPNSSTAGSEPAPQTQLRELVDEFTVLQRPQTAADRSATAWKVTVVPFGAHLVSGLTRLATTLNDGERVFVGIERSAIGHGSRRASSYVVGIYITGTKSYGGSTSFDPTTGYAPFPSPLGMRRNPRTGAWVPTWVSVVPDGVRRVHWTFFGPSHGRYERRLALTVPVVGNIAAASVAGTGTNDMVRVAWQNAAGRTIRTYTHPGVLPAVQAPSALQPPVLDVLRPDGIGSAQFGASPAVVRATIDSLVHQQGGGYTRGRSCGLDHEIKWWDQRTASGEPALTVYFRRSTFAGYQFGDLPGAGVLLKPGSGWSLATTRDLRVGDTLARGQQLYGHTFAISSAQGGTWSARSPGLIRGYSWGTPDQMPLSPRRAVATIDAGDVGCPALSP